MGGRDFGFRERELLDLERETDRERHRETDRQIETDRHTHTQTLNTEKNVRDRPKACTPASRATCRTNH